MAKVRVIVRLTRPRMARKIVAKMSLLWMVRDIVSPMIVPTTAPWNWVIMLVMKTMEVTLIATVSIALMVLGAYRASSIMAMPVVLLAK